MSDSERSDDREGTRQRRKKNYNEMAEKRKKRRRSQSVENYGYEKHKKQKNKQRDNSESESNEDKSAHRSKLQKYGNKTDKLDLDSENEKKKRDYNKNKRKKDKRSRSVSVDKKSERSPDQGKHKKSNKSIKNKFPDSDHRGRYNNQTESETEEQKPNNFHSKRDKYNKDSYKTASTSKKKYNDRKIIEDEYKSGDHNTFSDFQNRAEDKLKEIEGSLKHKEKSRSYNKESAKNKYDNSKSHDTNSKRDEPESGDEEDINSDRPYRHWNTARGPVRKNSDSYWNKYSDRLKESTDSVLQVGARYYSSADTLKKDKSFNNRDKDSQKEETDLKKENPTPTPNETPKPKKTLDLLTSKTGGAYIPPAKLRMMQESITDKSSAAYQRLAWEALKKSIQGHVNKVNTSNVEIIIKAIQKENIVRGKGLLCRSLIQAQAASPTFTNVYAAFVSVLNAKFPMVGELLLKRLIVQFRRGFKRNDKTICITAATFIAHLVNQEVAHEIVALEILTMLIETPTNDSVEVAIAFMKECGMKLTEVASKGIMAIFDMLRNILHEGQLEKRVQYMIEVMFQIRKEDFKAHPAIVPELNLLAEEDRIQHMITLEENHDPQDILNVFKLDPDYEANEAKYKSVVDISEDESEGEDGSGSDDSDDESDEDEEEDTEKNDIIIDRTETNLVALRKTIYLTIQSSLDFEECAHKLLRMELKPGQEIEMVHMFIDCCAEQRTYEKFFGLLSQRFCQINRTYIGPFEETFRDSYATIHRMTNDKLRNVAKLFAHLLYTDAISWDVLATIRLNEDDTTSSSRIFIKILFLELSEYMGLAKLNQRVKEPNLQVALAGLFPRDNPKHTRFAINFFTSIGLGGLTDELREHLKAQPRDTLVLPQLVEDLSSSSSSSSESSSLSSSGSSSSDLSSSSDSSSSESESSSKKKSKNRKVVKKKKKPTSKREKDKKTTSSKKNKVTPTKSKKRSR